ncbi:hypothetical protein [Actinokineospora sp. UTMC 2448]|uniref:hypothetical protein n=1 Tax=Actinokineospora sp. UTMC 2448 TaxID=2268449 RepID=UPI0021641FC1|nr:hypothetical protein [Actinokineospora sp. UTMC 2448]UVS80227.1 hypothetical protein Actkin_03977 [Actinokineospora sp. UTMC 2448]
MFEIHGMRQVAVDLAVASSQGFTFTGPGAQVLLDAVTRMQDRVNGMLLEAQDLAFEPSLGQTPAAQVYRPFMASVATDPVQGFLPFLQSLQQDLASIEESLKATVTEYRTQDETSAQNIKSVES